MEKLHLKSFFNEGEPKAKTEFSEQAWQSTQRGIFELSANHAWTLNESESQTKLEFSEQAKQEKNNAGRV